MTGTRSAALIACLAWFAADSTALAEPTIKARQKFYSVSGKTAEAIRTSMTGNRPGNHDSDIEYRISWRFRWDEGRQSCKIFLVGTNIDLTVILPKLRNRAAVPPALRKDWDAYYAALYRHAETNTELVVEGARRVEQKIANMRPRRTCRQLEDDANRIGRQASQRTNRLVRSNRRKFKTAWPPR